MRILRGDARILQAKLRHGIEASALTHVFYFEHDSVLVKLDQSPMPEERKKRTVCIYSTLYFVSVVQTVPLEAGF
jgi:hypothetical protein